MAAAVFVIMLVGWTCLTIVDRCCDGKEEEEERDWHARRGPPPPYREPTPPPAYEDLPFLAF